MFAPVFGLVIAVSVLSAEIEPSVTEIDGDWQLVSICTNGHMDVDEKAAKEDPNLLRLEKGNCRTVDKSKLGKPAGPDAKKAEDTDDDTTVEYRLKPNQGPKQIDWVVREAGEKNLAAEGIYRLKDDELVICFTVIESEVIVECLFGDGGPEYETAQSPRPTTFEPAMHAIWTLKRVPAEKGCP